MRKRKAKHVAIIAADGVTLMSDAAVAVCCRKKKRKRTKVPRYITALDHMQLRGDAF